MKINISNLSEGSHEYDFEESPSLIKLDERFSRPVVVRIELEKRRRQLFLTGHVETVGRFVCDRCLDDFDCPVKVDYRMTYVYNESDAGEVDKDELTVIHASTNEIKIDDDVKDYVILAVPQKILCREDCAGLCGTCGANLNRETCNCAKEEVEPNYIKLNQKKKIANNN